MKNSIQQLFVYGTLRSNCNHSAASYLSKSFDVVGMGKVRGLLFDMGSYPAAIPTSKNNFIIGELCRLKINRSFAEAMVELDEYEGASPLEGEHPLYHREITEVWCNGQLAKAWMYWYNDDVSGCPIIPSGDFFHHACNKIKV